MSLEKIERNWDRTSGRTIMGLVFDHRRRVVNVSGGRSRDVEAEDLDRPGTKAEAPVNVGPLNPGSRQSAEHNTLDNRCCGVDTAWDQWEFWVDNLRDINSIWDGIFKNLLVDFVKYTCQVRRLRCRCVRTTRAVCHVHQRIYICAATETDGIDLVPFLVGFSCGAWIGAIRV